MDAWTDTSKGQCIELSIGPSCCIQFVGINQISFKLGLSEKPQLKWGAYEILKLFCQRSEIIYVICCTIRYYLYNSKNAKKKKKKKKQRRATISKVAGRNCTKSNTPTRLPNCTNGTKSRNSSHIHIYWDLVLLDKYPEIKPHHIIKFRH